MENSLTAEAKTARRRPAVDRRPCLHSGLELLAAMALVEVDLWYLRDQDMGPLRSVLFGLLALVFVRSHLRRRRAALAGAEHETRCAARAWIESVALTFGFALVLLAGARALHRDYEGFEFGFVLKPTARVVSFVANRMVGAIGQQFVLHRFLWPVCVLFVSSRKLALLAVATIFGCFHLPSLTLVVLSSCGCLVWLVLYQRNGRLVPLVASHVVLSVLSYGALPDRLVYNMKVGADALAECSAEDSLNRDELNRLVRFFASDEYSAARGGTDERYLQALYADILGRRAPPKELAIWRDQLTRRSRARVAAALLTCKEARLIKEGRANPNTGSFNPRTERLRSRRLVLARDGAPR